MRYALAGAAALLLGGCSESPAPVSKAPEAPPAPITGRQAFQYMYGSSRIWATDSLPLTIRSLSVPGVKPADGKAGAWEVVFVSEMKGLARTYTWSAVETENVTREYFRGSRRAGARAVPTSRFHRLC